MLRLILDCFTPDDIKWLNAQNTLLQRRSDHLFEIAAKSAQAGEMIDALIARGIAPSETAVQYAIDGKLSSDIQATIRSAIPQKGDERRAAVQNLLGVIGSTRTRQL